MQICIERSILIKRFNIHSTDSPQGDEEEQHRITFALDSQLPADFQSITADASDRVGITRSTSGLCSFSGSSRFDRQLATRDIAQSRAMKSRKFERSCELYRESISVLDRSAKARSVR